MHRLDSNVCVYSSSELVNPETLPVNPEIIFSFLLTGRWVVIPTAQTSLSAVRLIQTHRGHAAGRMRTAAPGKSQLQPNNIDSLFSFIVMTLIVHSNWI